MALSSGDFPELSPLVLRGLDLGRKLGARTIMFHEAVAEKVGLNATDMKCLDLAREAGEPITAGKLAEITGLTSGAITGVIDHLERAGLVRRTRDPQDRRKVLVETMFEPMQHLIPIYHALGRAMAQVCLRYNENELEVIYRFLEESSAVLQEQTQALRGATGEARGAESA